MLTILIGTLIGLIFWLVYLKKINPLFKFENKEEAIFIICFSLAVLIGVSVGVGFLIPNTNYKVIGEKTYSITSIENINTNAESSECGCGCHEKCAVYEIYYNKNGNHTYQKITVPDGEVKYSDTNQFKIKKLEANDGILNHFSLRSNQYNKKVLFLKQQTIK